MPELVGQLRHRGAGGGALRRSGAHHAVHQHREGGADPEGGQAAADGDDRPTGRGDRRHGVQGEPGDHQRHHRDDDGALREAAVQQRAEVRGGDHRDHRRQHPPGGLQRAETVDLLEVQVEEQRRAAHQQRGQEQRGEGTTHARPGQQSEVEQRVGERGLTTDEHACRGPGPRTRATSTGSTSKPVLTARLRAKTRPSTARRQAGAGEVERRRGVGLGLGDEPRDEHDRHGHHRHRHQEDRAPPEVVEEHATDERRDRPSRRGRRSSSRPSPGCGPSRR